jgi:putative addiction module component (TIGR02574 family)
MYFSIHFPTPPNQWKTGPACRAAKGTTTMNPKSEAIISDALRMPDEDRALIAERLIASLDHEYEKDVEIAWQTEVQRRAGEIDSGMVTCLPWEEVRARLRRTAHARI